MMSDHARIGVGYDAVASAYDGHLDRGRWIRRMLWRRFDRLFRPGDRVLDAGCGTGIDTLHLAGRRVRVTAVDASPGMIAELRAKLSAPPPGRAPGADVRVELGDVNEVVRRLEGPFDGIVSSFAALNTVDLGAFALEARRLLRPGGRIVCHLLSPGWRGGAGPAVIDVGGQSIAHLLLPPEEIYERHFEAGFVRREAHAVGFLVGARLERWAPEAMLDLLGRIESRLGAAAPLLSAGRFFVMDLERRPT